MNENPTSDLSVDIVTRPVSDKSKVYSVVIRETGGIAFLELDCITQRHAQYLRSEIRASIEAHTNLSVDI